MCTTLLLWCFKKIINLSINHHNIQTYSESQFWSEIGARKRVLNARTDPSFFSSTVGSYHSLCCAFRGEAWFLSISAIPIPTPSPTPQESIVSLGKLEKSDNKPVRHKQRRKILYHAANLPTYWPGYNLRITKQKSETKHENNMTDWHWVRQIFL